MNGQSLNNIAYKTQNICFLVGSLELAYAKNVETVSKLGSAQMGKKATLTKTIISVAVEVRRAGRLLGGR